MEKTLIFRSVDEIRLKKLLRFIIPTYLTSLFTTVYTCLLYTSDAADEL